jgi:hypothetical protein
MIKTDEREHGEHPLRDRAVDAVAEFFAVCDKVEATVEATGGSNVIDFSAARAQLASRRAG